MYSSVFWTGQGAGLPWMNNGVPERSAGWQPLLGSTEGIPWFWWFLVERTNCFWRAAGDPVFIIQKSKGLTKAGTRFAMIQDALEDDQLQSWDDFYNDLACNQDMMFIIEPSSLWRSEFGGDIKRFEAYMNDCLLPLEISKQDWLKLSLEQKKAHFPAIGKTDSGVFGLSGEPLRGRG